MTPQEIQDAIATSPALQAHVAAGDYAAAAAALSDGRTKISSHFASERGILERYPGGPVQADELLAALEAFAATAHPMARIVGRALKFLAQPEGLDIGSPATQGLLDQLTAGEVLTQTQRDGLRAMATAPDPVTWQQVQAAVQEGN
jgi:hypothetical protein